jgi:glutamine synthetase
VAEVAGTEGRTATVDEVVAGWRKQGIRNVRFELPDMHGTSRSKIIPLDHVEDFARRGLNMYGRTVVLDSRSDVVPGTLYNEEVGYADQVLHPDPATASVVPWAEATGRMICDPTWADGRKLEAAPRRVFRRVLDRCHELGTSRSWASSSSSTCSTPVPCQYSGTAAAELRLCVR